MLITDQRFKWAVAHTSKEKQQLNAATPLPLPQLSTGSLLLSFSYNSVFTTLLQMDGILITAFGINCTDAIQEHRNVRACREAMRKAKVHLESNLARNVKDNKKGFFKYISSKRKARDNVGPAAERGECPGDGGYREDRVTERLLCFSLQC